MKVISLGTFDLFHYGHIKLLKKCREIAGNNEVIIGLNTDEFIKKYKSKPPIMSYEERKRTLLESGLIDQVVKNNQINGSADRVIEESGARLIVIGSDWARKPYLPQLGITQEWLDSRGIGVAYVPYTHEISTTELKKRINEN